MTPKVFISHASEDKERFVLEFAERLLSKGIDAWVDKWEMHVGDSLVRKIFEEGIKNANAFIIVLSKYSVEKPWVLQELDAGVVRSINGIAKIMPVVIDDCTVPECLQSTKWIVIKDANDCEKEFNEIVSAIYGHSEKPALGDPPAYVKYPISTIDGLSKEDSIILKLVCEQAIESGDYFVVDLQKVKTMAHIAEIDETTFFESIDILDRRNFVEADNSIGGPAYVKVLTFGLQEYSKQYMPKYSEITTSVISKIVNEQKDNEKEIAEELMQPRLIVEHILDLLEQNSYVSLSKSLGGVDVYNISPELKRLLK